MGQRKNSLKKGLKVLLLERGGNVRHGVDYKSEHKPPWEFTYRDQGDRKLFNDEYKIQKQCYAFGEATKNFFVNDKKHPTRMILINRILGFVVIS